MSLQEAWFEVCFPLSKKLLPLTQRRKKTLFLTQRKSQLPPSGISNLCIIPVAPIATSSLLPGYKVLLPSSKAWLVCSTTCLEIVEHNEVSPLPFVTGETEAQEPNGLPSHTAGQEQS